MKLLIKGWIGIYHSYAVVNYFQLKSLLKRDDIDVYFEELPFYSPAWKKSFACDLPFKQYQGEEVDLIYRIAFPYVIEETNVKQILFYTSECGNFIAENFNKSLNEIKGLVESGKLVLVTPSERSAEAFTKHHIPVEVIPHGVDSEIFKPKEKARNAEKVFLNVSAMSGNKNIPLILKAFSQLDSNNILILKGSKELYRAEESCQKYLSELDISKEKREELFSRIIIILDSFNFQQMNELYNCADVYLDAGVNEGFTLPIVESMACGLPVILNSKAPLAQLSPYNYNSIDELVELMKRDLKHVKISNEYKWESVVNKLVNLIRDVKATVPSSVSKV